MTADSDAVASDADGARRTGDTVAVDAGLGRPFSNWAASGAACRSAASSHPAARHFRYSPGRRNLTGIVQQQQQQRKRPFSSWRLIVVQ